MSDLFTTTQDAYRSACIATFVTLVSAGHGLAERVKDETRGQTAAEYMGVLLLVAAIITVVVTAGVGTTIKNAIVDQINDIKGAKPDCSQPGKC
jgi:pilus assembly protein Flp/PilA